MSSALAQPGIPPRNGAGWTAGPDSGMMRIIMRPALLHLAIVFALGMSSIRADAADATTVQRPAPPPAAAGQRPGTAALVDDCRSDSECVSIASVSPSCRHVDPKSREVCPGVDRKRAADYGRVDCAVSNPCRAAAGYRCRSGSCIAVE